MTDVKKLSEQYGKLVKKIPISDAEYAVKYAIALVSKLPNMSIELLMIGIKSDGTITPLQKKLIKVLLHYKVPALRKILKITTSALNNSPREAVTYDATNMDSVDKEMAEATKYLFREELRFCLRYALSCRNDPKFNLKKTQARIKKSTLLKPMLKRSIISMLPFRTSDLENMHEMLK